MGFEAYAPIEDKYQTDVERLSEIAIHVIHSNHGSFLKVMADAWLRADYANKRILKPAWAAIVTKYDLDKEAEG